MSKKRRVWKKKQRFQRFIMHCLNERSYSFHAAFIVNQKQAMIDLSHGKFDL